MSILKEREGSLLVRLEWAQGKTDRWGMGEEVDVELRGEEADLVSAWLHRRLGKAKGAAGLLTLSYTHFLKDIRLVHPTWSAHSFRHGVVTHLLHLGYPLRQVALLTGHHDLVVARQHYAKRRDEEEVVQQRALGRVLGQAVAGVRSVPQE